MSVSDFQAKLREYTDSLKEVIATRKEAVLWRKHRHEIWSSMTTPNFDDPQQTCLEYEKMKTVATMLLAENRSLAAENKQLRQGLVLAAQTAQYSIHYEPPGLIPIPEEYLETYNNAYTSPSRPSLDQVLTNPPSTPCGLQLPQSPPLNHPSHLVKSPHVGQFATHRSAATQWPAMVGPILSEVNGSKF